MVAVVADDDFLSSDSTATRVVTIIVDGGKSDAEATRLRCGRQSDPARKQADN